MTFIPERNKRSDDFYIQCKLSADNKEDIRFIPEKLAKKSINIIVKETEEEWKVIEVYKDSRCNIEDINRSKTFKDFEYAGRQSYKEKGK